MYMKGLGHKGGNSIKHLGSKYTAATASFMGHKGYTPASTVSSATQGLQDIYNLDSNSVNSYNMPVGLAKLR
jgi:hypothetical protein